ncbi:MAG: class I SAM-dependent methyltransferase [Burkholderiales bacterium]
MLGKLLIDLFRRAAQSKPAGATETTRGYGNNPLAEYFYNNPGRTINKWIHYFEIYHRHFAAFRGRSPVVVEIGVQRGGSLQMWHHYFGPGAQIVGIDIDPRCRQFGDPSTTILIGDQADRGFLAQVRERVPHIDILIDDGGHKMTQQIVTFEELYPHIQPHGIYLCEDMHTSLWPEFGGGYRREGTFLEYGKALVDRLYAWHSLDFDGLAIDKFTTSTHSLHFYDSVLVLEKHPIERPRNLCSEPLG